MRDVLCREKSAVRTREEKKLQSCHGIDQHAGAGKPDRELLCRVNRGASVRPGLGRSPRHDDGYEGLRLLGRPVLRGLLDSRLPGDGDRPDRLHGRGHAQGGGRLSQQGAAGARHHHAGGRWPAMPHLARAGKHGLQVRPGATIASRQVCRLHGGSGTGPHQPRSVTARQHPRGGEPSCCATCATAPPRR